MLLKSMKVGVVYAAWSGIGIILISLAGFYLFEEKLSAASLL